MNNVLIRLEQPGDQCAVEALTRDAFWDVYKPGCDEHLVAHRLRTHPDFIPELDFVALDGDKIIGNIGRQPVQHRQPDGALPDRHFRPAVRASGLPRQGVGALVRHSLNRQRRWSRAGVALTGSPGIIPASAPVSRDFGITDAEATARTI